MSPNSPQPNLVSRLLDAIEEASGTLIDDRQAMRVAIERELMPRQFEARGTITIDYAMGFSEAEAREWFPDAPWDDPEASHAGAIEDLIAQGKAPHEFWDCVRIKRDVVIKAETAQQGGRWVLETLTVGEL